MTGRVLIVEDNEQLRIILCARLAQLGYQPIQARDGAQALEKVFTTRPDLVLLDLSLPDMPGHDVARAILTICAHLPIVACSAHSAYDEGENALRAGMVAYLQKPIHAGDFGEIIERFIYREN